MHAWFKRARVSRNAATSQRPRGDDLGRIVARGRARRRCGERSQKRARTLEAGTGRVGETCEGEDWHEGGKFETWERSRDENTNSAET